MRLAILLLLLPLSVRAQDFPFVYAEEHPLTSLEAESNAALWGDLDGDGDLDLLVTNTARRDDIWYNEGGDQWRSAALGLQTLGVRTSGSFGDVDADGDLDLAVSTLSGSYVLERRTAGWTVYELGTGSARDASFADVDGDGDLDVFSAVRQGGQNELYILGAFGYQRSTGDALTTHTDDSSAGAWADVDGDGDLDLYVANTANSRNRLYLNDGTGVFDEIDAGDATQDRAYSAGASWGDVDGDGDLDLVVVNQLNEGNPLYLNDGNGRLDRADAAYFPIIGNQAKSSAFGDVDNDGDLDLVIATKDDEDVLYLNDGETGFRAIPFGSDVDGWAVGATLVDPDEDGDLDLFISHGANNTADRNRYFYNTTANGNHWLALDLVGVASNRSAIGARVDVYATIGGEPRRLVRVVESRTGRTAQAGLRLHLGLGDTAYADSVVIRWPSGIRQGLLGVGADQRYIVTEAATVTSEPVPSGTFSLGDPFPNPADTAVTIPVTTSGSGLLHVEVLDALGRRVWHYVAAIAAGESRDVVWPAHRTAFASGTYQIRTRLGDQKATRRVTLVR